MDTILERKNNKKKYLTAAVLAALILGYVAYAMITKKRTYNVAQSEITIKTVESDFFEDFMVFQARVEPMNSILVNIVEGGSVQEIFVSNGDKVTQGQPLARLYNPNTELNYMQQETAIIEQINNLNKAKLDLRNQELNLAKDLVSIEHDYQDAKNLYDLHKKLFDQEILAKNDWEKTQENFRFQKERINIIKQSVTKEKQANQIQIGQLNQSIGIMEKSLGVLRANKKNFLVMAPLSGRLSSFEPVLGQTYQQGQTLGKIDVMKGYKLLADVDEFYLPKVTQGQKGTVDFNGQEVAVVIAKVIPEIKGGKFQVELNFTGTEQLDLKQGLSFSVRLNLSEKTKSIVLSKGTFYQETAGKWIFVVNGNKAERRNITIGRENPLYYEITKGLQPGDKVITSTYRDYLEAEVLNIE
jgi:HlyD family secretion protein